MRKTQTLFTVALLVLLGSMGAAQAQNGNIFVTAEMVTQPRVGARMGGEREMSGSVWLTFSTAAAIERTTVTLHYSVPLATGGIASSEGTTFTSASATVVGMAENPGNDGNGTVMVSSITADTTTLVIRNVMLDVSGASGPVTVTADIESSEVTDFLRFDGPNIGTVVNDIVVGVGVTTTEGTVRTRGTDSGGETATLTLTETYKDAFMMLDELEIKFSGIPDGAKLTAEVTGIKIAVEEDIPNMVVEVVTTNMDAYATVGAVSSSGSATVMLGGDDMTEDGSDMRVAPDKVVLKLTLTAKGPLDVGEVTAEVTFTGDDFTEVFTDAASVFNIRPAQCELLFPVVSVLPMSSLGPWDTAISVTNPAYADEKADGGLTFTFYAQTDNMGNIDTEPPMFQTSPDGPGSGLSLDGTLAAGSTYQVLASEILDYTKWGTRFVGHVHLLADYTNCSGLGWVTNFVGDVNGGINQAYTATLIDADTGKD